MEYGLDAENDAVANYMILSLQTDQMSPAINVRPKYFSLHSKYFPLLPQKSSSDYSAMEALISASMARHGLTYLQLLRRVAVTCDEFILFVREKKVRRINYSSYIY